ncbi:MAG: pilin [Patescibacteria group bacterium]
MKNKIKKLIPFSVGFLPMMALAATDVKSLITSLGGVFNAIIPLLMVAATVFFLWGVLQFVTSGGDEDKRKEGRDHIIYGLIGLFIMVAVWGLVGAIADTFGLPTTTGIPTGPQ